MFSGDLQELSVMHTRCIVQKNRGSVVLILCLASVGTWFLVICTKSRIYYLKTISTPCVGYVCNIGKYFSKCNNGN